MMTRICGVARLLALLLAAISAAGRRWRRKQGGILRLSHFDSPASMSILEEATRAAEEPMMAVFNNLVLYDQHVAQNSLQSIVPDLATSWAWSEDGKELTFPLHQGVKWHDGKPFTAADVKCTWDLLMGTGSDKLRINPRKSWYSNVDEVTHERRLRGHLPPEAAAAGAVGAARLGLGADLSLPRAGARDAPASDRHRAVQIRRVQAQRIHQGRRATRITGSRAGPISTASSSRSCARSRRATWPSSPASSTSIPLWRDDPDPEGLQGAGAAGDLPGECRPTCRARC